MKKEEEPANLQPESSDPRLEHLINEIGEPVLARALVRYLSGPRRREQWGLLLYTEHALHLVFGTDAGWMDRLMGRGTGEQHRVTIPIEHILRIELPPRLGRLQRFFAGPSQLVTVYLKSDPPVQLDVEEDGTELLAAVSRHIAR